MSSLKNTIEKVINSFFLNKIFVFILFLLFNIILVTNFFDKHKLFIYNLNITISDKDLSVYSKLIYDRHLQNNIRNVIDNSAEEYTNSSKKIFKNVISYSFLGNKSLDFFIRTNKSIDLNFYSKDIINKINATVDQLIKTYDFNAFVIDSRSMPEMFSDDRSMVLPIFTRNTSQFERSPQFHETKYKYFYSALADIQNHNFVEVYEIKKTNFKYIVNYSILIILNIVLFILFSRKSKFNI